MQPAQRLRAHRIRPEQLQLRTVVLAVPAGQQPASTRIPPAGHVAPRPHDMQFHIFKVSTILFRLIRRAIWLIS